MPEATFSGEPDAGNPHLRFDEGRVGRGHWPSPSLLLYRLGFRVAARIGCQTALRPEKKWAIREITAMIRSR
jgi:hypothetical protein